MKKCRECKGKGSLWKTSSIDKLFQELVTCPRCNGKGIKKD